MARNRNWKVNSALVAAMSLLLLSGYRSARLAVADRQHRKNFEAGAREAIRLEPRNALYYAGLSELLERQGRDPRPPLRKAVALKPEDADIRIRLGLRAEMAGDLKEAERELLEAARRNRKYAPRWALTNFYFRRGDEANFWLWASKALNWSYADRTPLFELCWQLSPDAELLWSRAAPSRRPVLKSFVTFLMGKEEFTAATSLAERLSETAAGQEESYFLDITDRLLGAGHFAEALVIWNSIASRGLLPYEALDPGGTAVVTNPEIYNQPLGRGFDWRIVEVPGVHAARVAPAGLRIWLSGEQPERCEPLFQLIPLESNRTYHLTCRYSFSRSSLTIADAPTGLRWEIEAAGNGLSPIAASDPLVTTKEGSLDLTFRVPKGVAAGRLVLVHERPRGAMRVEGTLIVSEVRVTPANGAPSAWAVSN